jgi:phospholipase/carboxylesterase
MSVEMSSNGQLSARIEPGARDQTATTGVQELDDRGERSALLYVPRSYTGRTPVPLIVMLHGAGGRGSDSLRLMQSTADERGVIILAPSSVDSTWDVITRRRYGTDVRPIDAALTDVFARYAVDPKRVAVAGFSDGASYALSLGVMNGALFTHVIAFSPGFMAPIRAQGQPQMFISHGVKDEVLPIDRCSRALVAQLKREKYDVNYVEFAGGHHVPDEILNRAFDWFGT